MVHSLFKRLDPEGDKRRIAIHFRKVSDKYNANFLII